MGKRLFVRLGILMATAMIIVFGASLPAIGQEGYVGASYISSTGDFISSGETYDSSADGWKLWGGYNFNKYVGMELTYYDLGNFEKTQGSNTFKADVSAYDLAVRGILPLGKMFELSAKLGGSSVSIDSDLTGPNATTSASATNWELIYGLGAALKIGKGFGLRLEWEAWDVEGDLQAFSLGAYYRF